MKDHREELIVVFASYNRRNETLFKLNLGLKKSQYEYPLLLRGNPDNEKITVARLMGRILKSIGVIKKVI